MYNVKILTADEMREVDNFEDIPTKHAELFVVSNNDENTQIGVIYEHGDMWVYGDDWDSQVPSLKYMLDQITSSDDN